MPNPLNTPITPPRVAFFNPQTGAVAREWYMFFLSLYQLGGGSSVSLDELQLGPPPLTVEDLRVTASVVTKTANYTATADDYTILCDATAGDITITLPAASGLDQHIFNIKKIDSTANLVTITSTDTIDDEASVSTYIQWTNIVVQSDGANWYIL